MDLSTSKKTDCKEEMDINLVKVIQNYGWEQVNEIINCSSKCRNILGFLNNLLTKSG